MSTKVKCKTCNGLGWIPWEGSPTATDDKRLCTTCNGDGKLVMPRFKAVTSFKAAQAELDSWGLDEIELVIKWPYGNKYEVIRSFAAVAPLYANPTLTQVIAYRRLG